jgi:selenophosphate synthetase-related protein
MVERLRANPGLLRKRIIGEATSYMDFDKNFYEDGGIISLTKSLGINTRGNMILAGDGICPQIIRSNPYRAGLIGMIINVNDIVAMGATPICALDFMHGSKRTLREIGRGLSEGSQLTGVNIIGGHTRLEDDEFYLAIAMLGHVNGKPLESTTARQGDDIIVAIDIDGTPSDSIDHCWVSYNKSKNELWRRWNAIISLNMMGKLTSGKDISMPGTMGTITILSEASQCGAKVWLDKMPCRSDYQDMEWWVNARQTLAYVVTCDPQHTDFVCTTLNQAGYNARMVGRMTEGSVVQVLYNSEQAEFWNWKKQSVFGYDKCKKEDEPTWTQ